MKKNKELLDIMGDIKDEYIENAKPGNTIYRSRKNVLKGIISAAALFAVAAGLQYYFLVRPLSDINVNPDSGNQVTGITGTSETTIPAQTSAIYSETDHAENQPDINYTISEIPWNSRTEHVSSVLRSHDKNSVWFCVSEGTKRSGYIYVEYNGTYYDFERLIEGALNNSANIEAAETDEYIIVYYNGQLFSQNKKTGEVFRPDSSVFFFGDMHNDGSTKFYGTDENGYIHISNSDSDNTAVFRYSPDLKLDTVFEGESADELINSLNDRSHEAYWSDSREYVTVPFDDGKEIHAFTGDASGLSAQYQKKVQFSPDPQTGSLKETGSFDSPLSVDINDGNDFYTVIYKKNGYQFKGNIYNERDEIPDSFVYDYDGRYLYIFENFSNGNKNMHTSMSVYSVSEDSCPYIKELNIRREKTDDNILPDGYALFDAVLSDKENSSFYCSIFRPSDSAADGKTADRSGICIGSADTDGIFSEISDTELNTDASCYSMPHPQSDGTFIYADDSHLYSFDSRENTVRTVSDMPEGYTVKSFDKNRIYKINDSTYILPPSSFSDDTGTYTMLTVK